ncbi:MAG: HD domain-containing protein [Erysipelotrichaceae bacterium]|nr:HD domain-containing protein [Erysipelotrichaceae bacterium]
MDKERLDKILKYLEEFFKNDYTGHDFWHTYRVYKSALKINEKEKGDEEIVALAALLHDVDDFKLVGQEKEPYMNAKRILKELGYEEKVIDTVVKIISEVSFRGKESVIPDSLEGKIVQDADRLDAIGAIGIARTFMYSGAHHSPMHDPDIRPQVINNKEEYYSKGSTTINHFYEKLLLLKDMINTDTAKKIAQQRHAFMEEYLKRFFDEWEARE